MTRRFVIASLLLWLLPPLSLPQFQNSSGGFFSQLEKDVFEISPEECLQRIGALPEDQRGSCRVQVLSAIALLRKGGMDNRIRAADILEKCAAHSRKNPYFYFARGLLYQHQNRYSGAIKAYRKALEIKPYFVPALVKAGECYFQNFIKNYHRFTDSEVPISFQEYAFEDYSNSKSYLSRAIDLDPHQNEALRYLCLLYFEMKQYQAIVDLLKQRTLTDPQNEMIHLFLGMAYSRLQEYPKANAHFKIALQNMAPALALVFRDPGFLLTGKGQKARRLNVERYWAFADPLFLSEENERLLEQYTRMAYVFYRFEVPELNLPGWQTDRGLVYLKYGPPQRIVRMEKEMADISTVLPATEIWTYPDFQFVFEDSYWNGNFQFAEPILNPDSKSAFKSRASTNYSLVAENVFRDIPERFEYHLSGGQLPVRRKMYRFRGKEGMTEIWIPLEIKSSQLPDPSRFKLHYALYLWTPRDASPRPAGTSPPKPAWKWVREGGEKYWLSDLSATAARGNYQYSLELIDRTRQRDFVERDTLNIPGFDGNKLMLSDVVLCSQILPASPDDPHSRSSLVLIPNLSHRFGRQETMHMYLEVYNLSRSAGGTTDYRVESTLSPRRNGILGRLFGGSRKQVTIVNQFQGSAADDKIVQAIRLSNLAEGAYKLTIRVTDNISADFNQKTVNFRVIR